MAPQCGEVPSRFAIRSLWVLAGAAVGLLLLSRLVKVSMFFDGGIYATVARNLAEGRGSVWRLHFSETLFPVFSEHPPLMIWLQALGFAVFGDSLAVDKGFSLLTFVLCAALLSGIWMRLHPQDPPMRSAFPFVLVLVLVSGRVDWGFANGLLENLLAVFTLAAVLAVLVAQGPPQHDRPGRRRLLMAVAGLAVSLAVLTKGPVGLFPLATPAIHALVFRQSRVGTVVADTLVMLSVVVLSFGALLSFDAARDAIGRYLDAQLFASLSGGRGRYGGGLDVLRKILGVTGLAIVIVSLLALAGRTLHIAPADAGLQRLRRRRAVFLLVVGLSASLPIGLSPRVANFYFNPSLFFLAGGLGVLGAPYLLAILARLGEGWARGLFAGSLAALLGSAVVVVLQIGRPGTDERPIAQAAAIGRVACPSGVGCDLNLAACGEVWEDWALHTYLQRHHRISMARAADRDTTFVLTTRDCRTAPGYTDTGIDVSPYRLLKRDAGPPAQSSDAFRRVVARETIVLDTAVRRPGIARE